ncbi:hypothetical protein V1288_004039 [Bradyrhizobium sp. AZCC 2176]
MLLSQLCFSFASSQLLPVAWGKSRRILLARTCREKSGANG